ncbi:hypothetical protein ACIQB5_51855, partial [Streptomyces sp. NPDC088560]|uniref:hypothetical protein n=1 Tax=Streptomyces sp. NPDC088560 TaxID=3365868 RepID=UPI00382C9604
MIRVRVFSALPISIATEDIMPNPYPDEYVVSKLREYIASKILSPKEFAKTVSVNGNTFVGWINGSRFKVADRLTESEARKLQDKKALARAQASQKGGDVFRERARLARTALSQPSGVMPPAGVPFVSGAAQWGSPDAGAFQLT